MAVRELSKTSGMLTNKDKLPRNRYVVRCINEEFVESKSSKNPMITREWEIVHPDSVMVNGESKIIAGISVMQYLTVLVLGEDGKRDDEKSDKALARLRNENENLGFVDAEVVGDLFDDENPKLVCKGIVADAILSAEESKQYASPTPEELAQGKRFGAAIKGDDGKDIVVYRVKLDSILGRSSMVLNRPF